MVLIILMSAVNSLLLSFKYLLLSPTISLQTQLFTIMLSFLYGEPNKIGYLIMLLQVLVRDASILDFFQAADFNKGVPAWQVVDIYDMG
jgi:hypothetical protein